MGEPAIVGREVSKRFMSHRSRATSLKELALRQKSSSEELWALRDISVQIGRGETVGLIGANGSGKSTLLKVLAGILQPTTGSVSVKGRIASLLELGAGFNGELSGRDNVYLNAALLGLSRRQVDRLFDDIVAFSELERFIDNSVKHYSSGMYVRLGFAVAVHVDPDILLVDEVLAVGDEAFQQKCLAKIEQFQSEGRTILFVTHSLGLVEVICNRAMVLDHGHLVYDGNPERATATLRELLIGGGTPEPTPEVHPTEGVVTIPGIRISDRPGGVPVEHFRPGQPFALRVELDVNLVDRPLTGEVSAVVLGAADVPIWVMRTNGVGGAPPVAGRWLVDFTVPELPPLLGGFAVAVSVVDTETGQAVAERRFDDYFTIRGNQSAGLVDVPFTAIPHRVD